MSEEFREPSELEAQSKIFSEFVNSISANVNESNVRWDVDDNGDGSGVSSYRGEVNLPPVSGLELQFPSKAGLRCELQYTGGEYSQFGASMLFKPKNIFSRKRELYVVYPPVKEGNLQRPLEVVYGRAIRNDEVICGWSIEAGQEQQLDDPENFVQTMSAALQKARSKR